MEASNLKRDGRSNGPQMLSGKWTDQHQLVNETCWDLQQTEHEQYPPIQIEAGEIDFETDQDPSILEVPAINWARHVEVKSAQYVKMGHAPKTAAQKKRTTGTSSSL